MEDAIRAVTRELVDAVSRGDAAAAAACYADDSRLLTPAAEVISGRAQIEAFWRAGIAVGLAGLELGAAELQVGASVAVEIGRYVLRLDTDGAERVEEGKYVAFHRRQVDGSWRRSVDVFNPDEPGGGRPQDKEEQ